MTSDQTLDDSDVQVLLAYMDGSTAMQTNVAAGFPQTVLNGFSRTPLAPGVGLATTSGLWSTGKLNDYKVELDASIDPALATPNVAPRLMFRFGSPNQTIFIDPEIEFS